MTSTSSLLLRTGAPGRGLRVAGRSASLDAAASGAIFGIPVAFVVAAAVVVVVMPGRGRICSSSSGTSVWPVRTL
jgi:hypothetical protein